MIFVFLRLSNLFHCIIGSRLIHLTRTDSSSFLFMAEWCSIPCMHHSFFNH